MKRVIFALFVVLLLQTQARADEEGSEVPPGFPRIRFTINPFYHSIGLKLGNVLSVRRQRPVFRTFEGEMMLGFGTNPDTVVDRQCMQTFMQQGTSSRRTTPQDRAAMQSEINEACFLFDNPWRFSFLSRSLFNHMVADKDGPVVIYYVNYYVALSHLLMKTGNQVLDVFAVRPNLNLPPRYAIRAWKSLYPESGVITGRVVHASMEDPFRKTYEIIVQESENANNFRAMSVNDRDLFQYITQTMLTGKRVRVTYVRLFSPHARIMATLWNYMTNVRVTEVEIVPD